MKSVPCPKKDNGICTIPDKTAVVKGGMVSIQSRDEIEAALPQLELSTDRLEPLEAPVAHENLIAAIDTVGSVVERDSALAANVFGDPGKGTAVLVNCSCGDIYVAYVK